MAKKRRKKSPISDDERSAALRYLTKVRQSAAAERAHAEAVLARHRKDILAKAGVLSVDVGIKTAGDLHTSVYAICVYVDKKAYPHEGKPGRAPKGYRRLGDLFVPKGTDENDLIPPDYDGVPTDVIAGGTFQPTTASRPQGGDEIYAEGTTPDEPNGSTRSKPGTLGCGVLNKFSKRERYLTCAHVLTFLPKTKSPVISSDRDVFDEHGNLIGQISSESGQNGDWAYDTIVDCAAIEPTDPRKRRRVPVRHEDDDQPIDHRLLRPDDEVHGTEVWTRGAVTGKRVTGKITNINGSPPLLDGTTGDQQILIAPKPGSVFAVPGDSGAIVCDGKLAIGIVRAVNDQGIVAACPLVTREKTGVCDLLNLSFEGRVKP